MAVPGRKVGITNRPVDAVAVVEVGLEIEIAPAPAGAPPEQAAAAQMIAAYPAKLLRPIGEVRVLAIVDEEMLRRLAERVILALDRVIALVQLLVTAAAMPELPRLHPLGDVVLPMFDVPATLDDERAQAVLRQLLGGPATGDPGADDDGVEGFTRDHGAHVAHARPSVANGTQPSKRPGTWM